MTIEQLVVFMGLGVLIASVSLIGLCLYLLKHMWDKIEEDKIP